MHKNESPGILKNNSRIVIHTVSTQKLLEGTKHARIGLFSYCARVMQVYKAALREDPYAELYLLKIYEAGVLTRQKLRGLIKKYTEILDSEVGCENDIFFSKKPKIYPLTSCNEYIMLGVILIKQFDHLARIFFTVEKLLLANKQDTKPFSRNMRRKIRRFFHLPFHWHDFGVTREDIHNDTDKAKLAYKTMGKLHPDVLQRRLKAKYVL